MMPMGTPVEDSHSDSDPSARIKSAGLWPALTYVSWWLVWSRIAKKQVEYLAGGVRSKSRREARAQISVGSAPLSISGADRASSDAVSRDAAMPLPDTSATISTHSRPSLRLVSL